MNQEVQDKINLLAQKIKGLSVQELHSLSKEVESQRKRQDYEETKWLDTEIRKGDINEFETPEKIDTLVSQGIDIQKVNWNKLIDAIHSNASKYRPVAQAVIYNGYKFTDNKELVQRREVRRVIDYCLAHPEKFKTTKMRIDARMAVRQSDKYERVELPEILAQEKVLKKELQNNDINIFENAEKINRLVNSGVDIQSVKWDELYSLFAKNQRKYAPIIRAVMYNGYDFSYNPDILHKKDVRHEVNYCLAHPEGFKTPEIRTAIRSIVRENDKYYKELPKIQAQQQIEKERQKKEQRENDINNYISYHNPYLASTIYSFVEHGGDIQKIDWSLIKHLSRKKKLYKKVMKAIIYNGYDFNQALSVSSHSKVLPLAEECLQHPKAFKVEGAYESLQSIVPIAREYLDQRNEDYKLALEQEKQARLLEQKKEEEYLERQRIIVDSGINAFSSAEKINKCVENGADIQWIDWNKVASFSYRNSGQYEKVVRAIIYNGYDFTDAIPVFEHSKVQKAVEECMKHPKNFRVKGAYEKLQQFIVNMEQLKTQKQAQRDEERRQAQIARDNDVNIFTNAEKIDKVVRKGIDIQQVDWNKISQLEGAQYDKIVRAVIYNGYDFTEKQELLNNGKINALARDCLKHPDAFKVKAAYEKLDKQIKAQKVDKILKVLATHKTVQY